MFIVLLVAHHIERWPMLPCNWSMRSPSSIVLNESACLRKASMQSVDDKAPVPTASNLGSAWFCSIPNHTKSISSGFQPTSADYNLRGERGNAKIKEKQTDQPVWKERERHLFTHSTAALSMRVCMCHCPTSPANPSNPGTSERASKALGIWPQRAFVPPLGSLAEQSPEDPPQLRQILKMLQISVSLSHDLTHAEALKACAPSLIHNVFTTAMQSEIELITSKTGCARWLVQRPLTRESLPEWPGDHHITALLVRWCWGRGWC